MTKLLFSIPQKPGNSSSISIPIVVATSINMEFGYDVILIQQLYPLFVGWISQLIRWLTPLFQYPTNILIFRRSSTISSLRFTLMNYIDMNCSSFQPNTQNFISQNVEGKSDPRTVLQLLQMVVGALAGRLHVFRSNFPSTN